MTAEDPVLKGLIIGASTAAVVLIAMEVATAIFEAWPK